jgi:hypothetical protein
MKIAAYLVAASAIAACVLTSSLEAWGGSLGLGQEGSRVPKQGLDLNFFTMISSLGAVGPPHSRMVR